MSMVYAFGHAPAKTNGQNSTGWQTRIILHVAVAMIPDIPPAFSQSHMQIPCGTQTHTHTHEVSRTEVARYTCTAGYGCFFSQSTYDVRLIKRWGCLYERPHVSNSFLAIEG